MSWWTRIQLSWSSNWQTRERAAKRLGDLRDVKAVWFLISAVAMDSHKEVREKAMEAIVKIGDSAVEPLIAGLKFWLKSDPRDRNHVVESVVKVLAQMGPAAVDPLIAALKDPNKDMRHRAAEALRDIGSSRAIQPLIEALKDSDSYVRCRIVGALGKFEDDRVVEPLIAALKDSNGSVRRDAAKALGETRNPRAIEPLIASLTDDGCDSQVIWALDKINPKWVETDTAVQVVPSLIVGLKRALKGARTREWPGWDYTYAEMIASILECIDAPESKMALEEYNEFEKNGPFPDLAPVVGKCSACAQHVYSNSALTSEILMINQEVGKLYALATTCPNCNDIYCTGCAHIKKRQCPKCGMDVVGLRYKAPSVNSSGSGDKPSATKRNIVPAEPFSMAVQLLHHAIVMGDGGKVKLFVELNPGNANAKHEDGSGTALHKATFYGDDEMVAELLANGADPNAKDEEGRSPLHIAAVGIGDTFDRGGKPRIVELLIAAGADINARASNGDTAKDYARRQINAGEVLAALKRAEA